MPAQQGPPGPAAGLMLDLRRQLSERVQRRLRDPLPEKLWKYLPPFRAPSGLAAAPAADGRVPERGELSEADRGERVRSA